MPSTCWSRSSRGGRSRRAWTPGPAPIAVQAEPVALEQIIHNLLTNALQALDQVPPRERSLSVRAARRTSDSGALTVGDSGPGIPPEVLPRIFEPFFTTREHGLGLGLSLCESLARAWAGSCGVHARSPRGAAFTPALAAGRRHERTAVAPHPPDRRRRGGAQQPRAADRHRGLAGAGLGRSRRRSSRASTAQRIGAIVLDVRMPGISGLTVLDTLVAQGVDQPVIMLTGHGTVEMCRRAFKAGAAEFLEKPVDDEACWRRCRTRCGST